MTRIDRTFAALAQADRKAFVAYIMAHDPDRDTSLAIMKGLPGAGVGVRRDHPRRAGEGRADEEEEVLGHVVEEDSDVVRAI